MNEPQPLISSLQALVDAEAAVEGGACIVRVEDPERDLLWHGAAGGLTRGGAPATIASPFRIASITKTFTATVVVQLAAAGQLELDQPMMRYLPAHAVPVVDRIHVLDGRSFGHEITVRHLLDHSSGLFDYASSAGFFAAIGENPARRWSPVELIEGAIRWGQPHFPPGKGYGYAYSDTAYVLAGLIVEHVDGRPLHEAYRARILDPLALADTYLEGHEPHRGGPIAHCAEGALDAMVIDGTADWAGGGLVSTVDDLATFMQALRRGDLVEGRSLDDMFDYGFRTLDPARHNAGYLGYGLGVDARLSNGRLLRGHRGHWGVLMHLDPASGLTITGTISQADRRPDPLMHGITALLPPISAAADLPGGPR